MRFRTTAGNTSTPADLSVEHGITRPAAASGGTRWAAPAASGSREDPHLETEDV